MHITSISFCFKPCLWWINLIRFLRFEEDYAGSLKHFELAAKYDPSNVVMSHTRLEALKNYLRLVAVGVENKGKKLINVYLEYFLSDYENIFLI